MLEVVHIYVFYTLNIKIESKLRDNNLLLNEYIGKFHWKTLGSLNIANFTDLAVIWPYSINNLAVSGEIHLTSLSAG